MSPYAGWATESPPEIPYYYTYECLVLITQSYVFLWGRGNQIASMPVCFMMHPPLQAILIVGIESGSSLFLRGNKAKRAGQK